MKKEALTLQELVQWGALGLVLSFSLLLLVASLGKRKRRKGQRKLRRHCAQCGLWEKSDKGESKFGICLVCGGVTTRGRSRKLG